MDTHISQIYPLTALERSSEKKKKNVKIMRKEEV